MQLKITIGMDNAAFEGDSSGPEAARILRKLAGHLEDAGDLHDEALHETLRDINGNKVGACITAD